MPVKGLDIRYMSVDTARFECVTQPFVPYEHCQRGLFKMQRKPLQSVPGMSSLFASFTYLCQYLESTSNRVFFNIWSACSYASGNNTLPLYGSWTSLCTANTVSLDDSQRKANEGSLGIVNPAWANIDVPGGGAFDLQKAVTRALQFYFVGQNSAIQFHNSVSMQSTTKRWSTLQVILPIISSAATAILVVIFMAIYQRYLSRLHWKAKVAELIRPVPKVKPVDAGILDRAWEIEPNAPTEQNESFVFVDMPSPVEPVPSRPRHYSDSSSEASQQDQALVPGGRVWPESFTGGTQQYQPLLLPIHDHSEGPENAQASSSSGKWRLPMKNMTMPWKKRPTKIREAAPTRRFDIYDYDHSSPSTSSKRSTFGSSGEQTHSRSDGARASRVSTIHEVSEDGRSSMNASYLEDDESSGLIANSRRYSGSVLVIGHDNRYSTAGTNMTNDTNMTSAINSYIGIVSPTATGSSYSPRNTLQLAKGKAVCCLFLFFQILGTVHVYLLAGDYSNDPTTTNSCASKSSCHPEESKSKNTGKRHRTHHIYENDLIPTNVIYTRAGGFCSKPWCTIFAATL